MSSNPDALGASGTFDFVTIGTDDIDLVALGGGPCREIVTITTGTLKLKRADGSDTATSSPLPINFSLKVQATVIYGASTATEVLVRW